MQHRLSLQQVAAELDVHYMTVYRYVRLGLLPAEKRNNQWHVDPDDLIRFRSADRAVGDADAPWGERMRARMISGDASGAWMVVESALAAGHPPEFVYTGMIAPAMARIGDLWAAGEVGVADEHLATAVATRVVGRLGPRFTTRGRRRGTTLSFTVEGDHHGLGCAMLSDILRGAGFEALDLGANTPLAAVVTAVQRIPHLAGLCMSINNRSALKKGAETVRAVRAVDDSLPIVCGGSAVTSEAIAQELGVDAWGRTLELVVPLLEAALSGGLLVDPKSATEESAQASADL